MSTDRYVPTREDHFSFGIWTVGWQGVDVFGTAVRPPMPAERAVRKLAEIGAYGVNFHDNDVFDFGASEAERDERIKAFRAALAETGLVVTTATTNLFSHPMFKEGAFTFRFDPDTFDTKNVTVQATARANGDNIKLTQEHDITFGVGFKWAPTDKVSVGGVYKQGPKFKAPTFFAGAQTNGAFVQVADTTFHDPDIAGLGVSYRPIPTLTVKADADVSLIHI